MRERKAAEIGKSFPTTEAMLAALEVARKTDPKSKKEPFKVALEKAVK